MKFSCFSHRDISMPSTFLFFFSSLMWHFSSFDILHAFIFGKTWYFRIMEISRTVYQGQRGKESLQHDFKTAHYILWTSVEVLPTFCLDKLVHIREFYCVCCRGNKWVWVSWFSSQPCRCLIWLTLARGVGIHLTYLLDKQIRPVHFFLDSQTQEVPTVQSLSCAQGLAEAPSTSKEQAILPRRKRKGPAWRQDGLTGQAKAYKV